jgi:hypothetical protein
MELGVKERPEPSIGKPDPMREAGVPSTEKLQQSFPKVCAQPAGVVMVALLEISRNAREPGTTKAGRLNRQRVAARPARRRGSETRGRGPLAVMRTLYRTRKGRGIGQAAHFHRARNGPGGLGGGNQ